MVAGTSDGVYVGSRVVTVQAMRDTHGTCGSLRVEQWAGTVLMVSRGQALASVRFDAAEVATDEEVTFISA